MAWLDGLDEFGLAYLVALADELDRFDGCVGLSDEMAMSVKFGLQEQLGE